MTKIKAKSPKILVDRHDAVLRETALAVSPEEIASLMVKKLIAKMAKALHAEEDGVAIAAPQVGESLRIFLVNGEALAMAQKKQVTSSDQLKDIVFINPEIIKASKKKRKMEEGCLSLRYLYGQVERSEKITIKAYDEAGNYQTFGASGLLAQIFQHEIDHLNGILFIDKAENIQDMPPHNG